MIPYTRIRVKVQFSAKLPQFTKLGRDSNFAAILLECPELSSYPARRNRIEECCNSPWTILLSLSRANEMAVEIFSQLERISSSVRPIVTNSRRSILSQPAMTCIDGQGRNR